MPRVKHLINNFTSGEVTPKLRARSELKAYRNGAREMTNVLTQRHGGFINRGGARFVDRVKSETTEHALLDFVFSATQAYIIVAGDQYFWFTLNGSLLTESTFTITGAADNGSGLIQITTSGSHGYSNGDYVRITGVLGTVEANDVWSVSGVTATTIDLVGSTFTNTYTSGGTVGKIVEVTTPYLEADLDTLDWSQDGDVVHITHQNYAPRTLTRTSATAFTLAVKAFNKAPKQAVNTTATTLVASGGSYSAGDSITMTASAALFVDTESSGHIYSIWESHGGSWQITAFTSTTVVTATVINTLSTTPTTPTTTWNEADWSGTEGWPRRNTFYEQRWVTGPTTVKPQTFWGSALGGPLDFDQSTTNDDDPFEHQVAANQINTITWFSPQSTLLIGTAGQEFKASGSANGSLTATDPVIRRQTPFGGKQVKPVQAGNETLFIDRSGRRVYSLAFSFQIDQFDGDETNILADHLLTSGQSLTRLAYQSIPDNIVWARRSDGNLLSMTYLPKNEIIAWAEHPLGGTDAEAESLAVIPNATTGEDNVYFIGKRTINGATHRYIEYFDSTLYVDSGVSGTSSPAATTLAGLTHLVGETVDVLGDDSPYVQTTVSATGTITTAEGEVAITESQIGLPIPTPTCTPNEIDPLILNGQTTFGRPKRPSRIYVRTISTPSIYINGIRPSTRSTQDDMDAAPPTPAQEDWDITELGYDDNATITITQTGPLPINVLGIFGEFSLDD